MSKLIDAIEKRAAIDKISAILESPDYKGTNNINKEKGGPFRLRSALHAAMTCNRDEAVVKLLLDHGADVNEKGLEAVTALHFVRDSKFIKLLLEYGANPHAKNMYGETPFYIFCSLRLSEVVIEFLKQPELDPRIAKGEKAIDSIASTKAFLKDCFAGSSRLANIKHEFKDAVARAEIQDERWSTLRRVWDELVVRATPRVSIVPDVLAGAEFQRVSGAACSAVATLVKSDRLEIFSWSGSRGF